jgi:hypothetical protein
VRSGPDGSDERVSGLRGFLDVWHSYGGSAELEKRWVRAAEVLRLESGARP